MTPLPRVRRIVTAIDGDGRSCIAEDGAGPAVFEMPGTPYRSDNLWRTAAAPSPVGAVDDVADHRGVLPPTGGSVIRAIDFPPQAGTPEEQAAIAAEVFRRLYPDADHHAGSARSASMHTTDTIDYAICMTGEIWAIMDAGEVLMKAGDVLIQRGTAHGWENRSDAMARMIFVLIDGVR